MLPRSLDYLPALLCMPEGAQGHTATAPHPKAGQDHHPSSEHPATSLHLGKKGGHVRKIRTKHLSCRNLLYFLLCTFCHSWKCTKWLTCLVGSSPLSHSAPAPLHHARLFHSQRGSQDP